MMNVEKLLAEKMASEEHYDYMDDVMNKAIAESDGKFQALILKATHTKEDMREMEALYWESVTGAEVALYNRGFFDALALMTDHGITEDGLLAAIEKAKDAQWAKTCETVLCFSKQRA